MQSDSMMADLQNVMQIKQAQTKTDRLFESWPTFTTTGWWFHFQSYGLSKSALMAFYLKQNGIVLLLLFPE